jgi:hypothetical protein
MNSQEDCRGLNGDLDVVAHIGDLASADEHGATVRIGEGDLGLAGVLHVLGEIDELTSASLESGDLLLKFLGGELWGVRLGRIAVVELEEVGIDVLIEVLECPLDVALGDDAGPVLGNLEFAAVDGDELAS